MAKSRESFERRQRARAKKAKADAKRERRLADQPDESPDGESSTTAGIGDGPDQGAVLAALAELHAAYDDEAISFDDFEERRTALLAQLRVD